MSFILSLTSIQDEDLVLEKLDSRELFSGIILEIPNYPICDSICDRICDCVTYVCDRVCDEICDAVGCNPIF